MERKKSNEVLGIILLAAAIFVLLSLFSYHPADRSWLIESSKTTEPQYANYMGFLGAQTSATLYEFLGVTSYFVGIFLLLWGWNRLFHREVKARYTKFVGFILFMVALCTLLQITLGMVQLRGAPLRPGGVVGEELQLLLQRLMNYSGTLWFAITALCLSLILLTRLSFLRVTLKMKSSLLHHVQKQKTSLAKHREIKHKKKMREEVIKKYAQKKEPKADNIVATIRIGKKTHLEKPSSSTTRLQRGQLELKLGRDHWELPSTSLLEYSLEEKKVDERELMKSARLIVDKFKEFSIGGSVLQIHPGPVVTTFEFKPDPGVRYSKMVSLVDDLCLALQSVSVRISRIPGKSTVGIEVPNKEMETIFLKEIIESEPFQNSPSKLTLCLGKLIDGRNFVTDLSRMPHLLIAGATGSGKSVALNSMICSIMYKATPDEAKLIMIDPKQLELGIYEDIPHLLVPVVTNTKYASNALKWAVVELENRLRLLANYGVRNIEQFNQLLQPRGKTPAEIVEEGVKPLPYIVVVIDELADLMILCSATVEESMTRLAQMARAVGIHLIVATQRPSVDILTGIIKANFPSRISFRVSSKVDSRTILDMNGAERLLGRGDMLFLPPGSARLVRIHGPLVTEKETMKLINFWKSQGQPVYDHSVTHSAPEPQRGIPEERDDMYEQAVRLIVTTGYASISNLQRKLGLGYSRAAKLIDIMEEEGIVGPADRSKPRKVLVGPDYLDK